MIKNNLKKIMKEKGIKQKYIANKIRVKDNYFSMIVNGKHIPSVEIALKLAKILNVSVEKIFYLDYDK
ncbi:helix-turn-helix transcriptional regulator [Clostridium sp. KNHs214]|uniref:helix-turn-helix transcriptional regulator n=1 Tax=Clostridium sp. KNHs214 TaxID=1540257 RepID=UPI00068F26CB|nr:helix-turn-helix transcriptional regulator [Clostridium sp. KNHs214]